MSSGVARGVNEHQPRRDQAASAAKLLAGANDPRGVAQARELFRQARQAALTKAEEYVVEGSDSGAATEHAEPAAVHAAA